MRNTYLWTNPVSSSADFSELQAVFAGEHPLVAQIMARRGFTQVDQVRAFLDPTRYAPTPPQALPDLITAADHLLAAAQDGAKVLVWGDFDADGQTASALLVDALRSLGVSVSLYIPDRLKESHGIRLDSLQRELAHVQPRILLTCDTGISAHEAVDYAKSQGVITLITDHHDLPPELPSADALVNPKRLPADHPLASLPGVGVAYKLVEYLYNQRQRADELPQFLDLVALGIVADVAQQTRDTRYLLQIGLDRLQNTQRTGLRALMAVAAIDPQRLTATDIGFQLGPRLNAAGRLADAALSVELLTTTDPARAQLLAAQLEGLNNQRRLHTQQITTAAQEQIERDPSLLDFEALVLANPAWHPGILGIVASRLADQYARPVVLLNTADSTLARGSARSAPGYDIGAAIAAQADLLITHGGHPGAAGLSLHPDQIPTFRRRLSNTLRETRDPSVRPGLQLDAIVPLSDLTLDLVRGLDRLAPFGEGNPRVTLATLNLTLVSAAYIGRGKEHRRLTVADGSGQRQTVVWWNSSDRELPQGLFDLAYQLEINTFKDKTELQLTLMDFRRSLSAPPEIAAPSRQVIDQRQSRDSAAVLSELRAAYPSLMIWAEGYRRADSPGLPLHELTPADVLVVYTLPAGPQAFQEALERVTPSIVVLMAVVPPKSPFSAFQRRLLELLKHVSLHSGGRTTLADLAGATAQTETTVQRAVDHLAAHGEIAVEWKRGGALQVAPGNGVSAPDERERWDALHVCWVETAAYRAFYRRATPAQLLGEEPE